mmetsp:Transcript_36122/g.71446  ORF Transcript_36122/g.71446 Transcript_36122/m.71446 type:complete len:199 (+) Transcript_36122:29-625(+)
MLSEWRAQRQARLAKEAAEKAAEEAAAQALQDAREACKWLHAEALIYAGITGGLIGCGRSLLFGARKDRNIEIEPIKRSSLGGAILCMALYVMSPGELRASMNAKPPRGVTWSEFNNVSASGFLIAMLSGCLLGYGYAMLEGITLNDGSNREYQISPLQRAGLGGGLYFGGLYLLMPGWVRCLMGHDNSDKYLGAFKW